MVSGLQVSIAASNRDVSDANADRECSELLRLERAVRALVAEHESLVAEHAALVDEHASLRSERDVLERKLDETMVDGRALEERLLAENQRRQDALKRVDELIGRLQPASIGAVAPQR